MGRSKFQRKWLSQSEYSEWLTASTSGSEYRAYCKVCRKEFDVMNMGEAAVKSHAAGSKHRDTLKDLLSISQTIEPFLETVQDSTMSGVPSVETPSISKSNQFKQVSIPQGAASQVSSNLKTISLEQQWTAEVIWAMKTVTSHFSYRSCTDIEKVFQRMFTDSTIAKDFSCGEKKCSYIVCYGLAPYFNARLSDRVRGLKDFVILFDESLNQYTHSKQMDFHIRFFDDDTKLVITRYYTSAFMGHAVATTMVQAFLEKCKGLNLEKLVQVSMDGPAVNWCFYDKLKKELKSEDSRSLIDIGSCGLHTVHNSLKSGFESWPVKDFLCALSWLMKDTPARREDFTKITGSVVFGLEFCSHRWVENVKVVKRALLVFDNFKIYVETVLKESKTYNVPKTKSFRTVKGYTHDPLMKPRLHFFESVAQQFEIFLVTYQTDKPMIPFLAKDLERLIRGLLLRFVKEEIVDEATTAQLSNIDYKSKKSHLPHAKIDIGISSSLCLKKLQTSGKVSELDILHFKMECKACLIACTEKLLQRCPLKYKLLRNLSCFDPTVLSDKLQKKICKENFKCVLEKLVTLKQICESDSHTLEEEYKLFLDTEVVRNFSLFKDFQIKTNRIDTFYADLLSSNSNYKNLWLLMKKLLILSHGQATVERGFSFNSQLMIENMKEESVISQRTVYDSILNAGGLLAVPITKSMLMYVQSARSKYMQALHQKKEEKSLQQALEKSTADERNCSAQVEILKTKKRRLEADVSSLNQAADELAAQAEKIGDMLLLTKSNSFRNSARQKQSEIEHIIKNICDLNKNKG